MSNNTSVVLIAIIGIIVPVLTLITQYIRDARIAKAALVAAQVAAVKVEAVRTALVTQNASVDVKLDNIHALVNSRLTEALAMIEELKKLARERAPNDPRVQELDKRTP